MVTIMLIQLMIFEILLSAILTFLYFTLTNSCELDLIYVPACCKAGKGSSEILSHFLEVTQQEVVNLRPKSSFLPCHSQCL